MDFSLYDYEYQLYIPRKQYMLQGACKQGHEHMVTYLLSTIDIMNPESPIKSTVPLLVFASNNDIKEEYNAKQFRILKQLLNRGVYTFDDALVDACHCGNVYAVDNVLKEYRWGWEWKAALDAACKSMNLVLVKKILECAGMDSMSKKKIKWWTREAVKCGNLPVLKTLLPLLSPTIADVSKIYKDCCMRGHLHIFKYLQEEKKYPFDLYDCLSEAIESGYHYDLVYHLFPMIPPYRLNGTRPVVPSEQGNVAIGTAIVQDTQDNSDNDDNNNNDDDDDDNVFQDYNHVQDDIKETDFLQQDDDDDMRSDILEEETIVDRVMKSSVQEDGLLQQDIIMQKNTLQEDTSLQGEEEGDNSEEEEEDGILNDLLDFAAYHGSIYNMAFLIKMGATAIKRARDTTGDNGQGEASSYLDSLLK
jgi:hypothetical protein